MEFSVLIKATGNVIDDRFWPCDLVLQDVIRACKSIDSPDWYPDDEASEPGDSEYSYLAIESSLPPGLYKAAIEGITNGCPKDNWKLANWVWERWGKEDSYNPQGHILAGSSWWATASDYQASGILTREEFEKLRDDLGAYASCCETLGTLGGPLGFGIVPDIGYEVETQAVIITMRVTPLLDVKPKEGRWERVRKAVLACHGI